MGITIIATNKSAIASEVKKKLVVLCKLLFLYTASITIVLPTMPMNIT
jgi:hypothetical protein